MDPLKCFENLIYPKSVIFIYSGTPLILSPTGQKNLDVLTRVLYKKMYGHFPGSPKNSGHDNEVAVRQAFTVLLIK